MHDYEHSWYSRNETPRKISLMRGLTVLTFLFCLLNMPGWPKAFEQRSVTFGINLTDQQILQGEAMTTEILKRVRERGQGYAITEFAPDFSRLVGLTDALQEYGGIEPGMGAPADKSDYRVLQLNKLVDYTRETIRSTALVNLRLHETPKHATDERDLMNAVSAYRTQHGGQDPWPSFMPPQPPTPSINWRHVAKRGIDGWILALIPAFLTIMVSFRQRRESLMSELLNQPWWPVMWTVLWPVGLWSYASKPGFIERQLQPLVNAYWESHKEKPSEEWMAAQRPMLMKRYNNLESALAAVQKYPELLAVNSRQAIATSWVVAMLAGPMNMMLGVVQAYASAARVGSGIDTVQVDSTRTTSRRGFGSVSGRMFGVMSNNAEGFKLPTLWAVLRRQQGPVSADAWIDAQAVNPVMSASATYAVNDVVAVEAGKLFAPDAIPWPGPDKSFAAGNSIGTFLTKFSGTGVAAHVTTKRLTLVTAALSGLKQATTDFSAWLKTGFGPVTINAGGHAGSEQMAFGMVDGSVGPVLVREIVVVRPDRVNHHDQAGVTTDLVYSRGQLRVGAHFEHDRWSGGIERKFPQLNDLCRVVFNVGHTDGEDHLFLQTRIQYGFYAGP